MENTCNRLLELCLRGEEWPSNVLEEALQVDDGRAFLSIVVERLGDLFEPRLCRVYDKLFRQAIEIVVPEMGSRIRPANTTGQAPADTNRVYVLSRITLGADVAVTSVLMDAAKRRYPHAEIVFVGPEKNFELFEADARMRHEPAPYARTGGLRDRLKASGWLWFDDGLVLDPDSRLSQLGALSVCPEDRYFFFESRSAGGDSLAGISDLAAEWAEKTLGVSGARPYVAPQGSSKPPADVTVSLGVGENPSKRLEGDFEVRLLELLAKTGKSVLVDKGGSEEERRRVEAALPPGMRTHEGRFAPFAAQIAHSKLFVGYDSAAGHVASACGVPLISIASGFVSERAAARWRPKGTVLSGQPDEILSEVGKLLQTER